MPSKSRIADNLLDTKTANYRPSLSMTAPYWGGPMGWGYFSLSVIDEMKRDPQVRLTNQFKAAPLHTAEFEFSANSSEVLKFVEETTQRYWQKSLKDALECMPYGFVGCEPLYNDLDGYIKFDSLKPLHPRDTRPYTRDGKLAYVYVTKGEESNALQYDPRSLIDQIQRNEADHSQRGGIPLRAATKTQPAKGAWFTYEPTFRPWYGMPYYSPMWWAWRLKTIPDGAMEAAFKAFYKHGFLGCIIRHPNEVYQDSAGEQPKNAQEYAQQIGEQIKSGANLALSSARDEKGNLLWEIEKYGGEVVGNFDQLLAYPDWLDRQISRAGGVPDEILTHDGNTGGYSRSNIAFLGFLIMCEQLLNHQLELYDDQILAPLVRFNFGDSARYTIKPKPLLPPPAPVSANVPGAPPVAAPEEQAEEPEDEETEAVTQEEDQIPIQFSGFDESKHHRGQPANAGQFGPGGGQKKPAPSASGKAKAKLPDGRTKAGKLVHRLARMPEHTIRQMADFVIAVSDSHRAGGVQGAAKEVVEQAKAACATRFQQIEGRYGRAAAIAMVAAWIGINTAGVFNPKIWLLAPEPMAMIVGAAEGVRALLGKKNQGDAEQAEMSGGGDEVLTVEKLYDLVREFDQVLSRSVGSDPGSITESAFRQALAKFGVELPEEDADSVEMSVRHAPEGGVTIQGAFYTGGEFIPDEVLKNATKEERKEIENRNSGHATTKSPKKSIASAIPDEELFKRTGEGFENLQKALGISKPKMGPKGADQVRRALAIHPGGRVIQALLSVDGSETDYDRNGFADRGMDAYKPALEGKFTKHELEAAAAWLFHEFNMSKENGHPNQYRWIRGVVQTVTPSDDEPNRSRATASEASPDEKPYHFQESLIPGEFHNAPTSQHEFFDTAKGPKNPKGRPGQGKLFDFSGTDNGHWVTIGGRKDPETGKRHGGSPVFIRDGQIIKRHPSLTGRKIDALDEEPAGEGRRRELNRSKEYARAVWAKKARKEGLDPASLHQLAAEMREHDKAFKDEQTRIMQRARELSKKQGFGNISHFSKAFRSGDSDQLKGLDHVAKSLDEEFPGYLGSDPESRLYEMLAAGSPEAMTEDEAYEQAFDHLMQHREDEVPFSQMSGHEDEIDEDLWSQVLRATPCYALKDEQLPHRCGQVDGLTIYIVDGDKVKTRRSMDFVEAGNGFRWSFIPKDEIWIDDDIGCHDWPYNAYHEAMEVRLMRDHGLSYDVAHERCNAVEKRLRQRGLVEMSAADKTPDRRIEQRAMAAAATFYDELQGELRRRLIAKKKNGANLGDLIDEARQVLQEFVDPLAQLLGDAQLAGWVTGAAEVAQQIPAPDALTGEPGPAPLPPSSVHPPGPFDTAPLEPGLWEWDGLKVWLPLVREGVKSLQEKQLVTREAFDALSAEERAKAFTVATLKTEEALGKVRDALVEAVNLGTGFKDFKETLDEGLGSSKLAIGHLENVFRTGTATAASQGMDRIADHPLVVDEFPYEAILPIYDSRLTALCRELAAAGIGGTNIFRRDDPVYQKYKSPRHWHDRCGRRLLRAEDAARRGIEEARKFLEEGKWPLVAAWVPEPVLSEEARKLWEQWSARSQQ